jgi:hypothetical protein
LRVEVAMSAFLVSHNRAAHRMVGLQDESHPALVREVIDGMIQEFRRHDGAADHGVIVYVPTDLPDDVADAWVSDYVGRMTEVER